MSGTAKLISSESIIIVNSFAYGRFVTGFGLLWANNVVVPFSAVSMIISYD